MGLIRAAGSQVGLPAMGEVQARGSLTRSAWCGSPNGQGYAVEHVSSHIQYSAFGAGCQANLDACHVTA